MSTMLFGVETWGRVGAVAILARHEREHAPGGGGVKKHLIEIIREVTDEVCVAQASNSRAFVARYDGRHGGGYKLTPDMARLAIGAELVRAPVNTFEILRDGRSVGVPRTAATEWCGLGGGIKYNCDEDPDLDKHESVLTALDNDVRYVAPSIGKGY